MTCHYLQEPDNSQCTDSEIETKALDEIAKDDTYLEEDHFSAGQMLRTIVFCDIARVPLIVVVVSVQEFLLTNDNPPLNQSLTVSHPPYLPWPTPPLHLMTQR